MCIAISLAAALEKSILHEPPPSHEGLVLRKIGDDPRVVRGGNQLEGARMTTLNVELEIGPGAEGSYPVVARAPGGEASITLRWSVTPAELDHQLAVIEDKVLRSSAVVRRVPTEDERPVRKLGQQLFEALITDKVLALYVASKQRARENDDVLRLVLRVRPPELARLPWEFLFDPDQQDHLGRYSATMSSSDPLATEVLVTAKVSAEEEQAIVEPSTLSTLPRVPGQSLPRCGLEQTALTAADHAAAVCLI